MNILVFITYFCYVTLVGEYESKPILEQEKTYNELKKRLELVASNEVDSEIVMEFYEDSCKYVQVLV